MAGRVFDTYAAALQHDQVDLPTDAERIGVVRQAMPWFYGVVDRNESALGPPPDLLDAVKRRRSALEAAGLSDAGAHNRALEELDYNRQYRNHLASDPDARAAVTELAERVAAGDDVVLVCYENTAVKRCHRTLLRRELLPNPGE